MTLPLFTRKTPGLQLGRITFAPAVERRCGARNSDPVSSHVADEAFRASGKASAHVDMILATAVIRKRCGATAHEIARETGILNNVQVSRRLSDLHHDNLVEQIGQKTCAVTRQRLLAWRLV